jgi:hypothetical protein
MSRTVNVAARYSAALWVVCWWVSVDVMVISLGSNLEGVGGLSLRLKSHDANLFSGDGGECRVGTVGDM